MKRFLTLAFTLVLFPTLALAQTAAPEAWHPGDGFVVVPTQCGPGGCLPGGPGGFYQPPPIGGGGYRQPPKPPEIIEGRKPGSPGGEAGVAVDPRIVAASVRVSAMSGSGGQGGSGTVFHVAPGYLGGGTAYVLTCRHVVAHDRWTLTVIWPDGKKLPAKFLAKDATADLSCLTVEIPVGVEVPFVPLAEKTPPKGQSVFQVGYPHGRGPIKRAGKQHGYVDHTATQWNLGLSFPVQSGDSGSGLFDAATLSLIGVVWGSSDRQAVATGAGDCARFVKEVCRIDGCFGIGIGIFAGRPKAPAIPPPGPGPGPNPGVQPPVMPPVNGNLLAELAKGKADLDKAQADIVTLKTEVATLKTQVASMPAGKDGQPGPAGPPGPAGKDGLPGPAGKDGISVDPTMLAGLQTQINLLRSQGFICELYDGAGTLLQTVPFSAAEPLRLKFFQTKAP